MIAGARFVRRDNNFEIPFNEISGAYKLPITRWTTELDARASDRTKQRRHGIWKAPTYLGKRIMRFEGDVLGESPADYVQQRLDLNRLMMPSVMRSDSVLGDLYIVLEGQGEEFHQECTIESWTELPVEALQPSRGTYLVAFKMFDPWMLGDTQLLTATPSLTGIGRSYDKTYDKSYPTGTNFPDSISVYNAGNAETFPIIKFYGPSTSPQAALGYGGSYWYLHLSGLSIGATDVVTVNTADRTVVRQTGENLYDYAVGSDWWALGTGINAVRYTAWEAQPGSKMEVVWQNAYML